MSDYEDDDSSEESFKGKSFLTFDLVMLQQVQIINRLASKELVRGRWDKKSRGDVIEWVYLEDGREAVINAIKMLKQGLVGDENPNIEDALNRYNKKYSEIDMDKLTDKDREEIIMEKLKTYNKIYTILLKILRMQVKMNVRYVERYK